MKNYLELDFKTGRFYDYSKTEKEGYEKYESSTGRVSYRKYFFKGIYGKLKSIYVKEDSRFGLQLKIILENGDQWYMLKMGVFSGNGRLDTYMESLAGVMGNLEIGEDYRFFGYSMDVDLDGGGTATRRGIVVHTATLDGNGEGEKGEKLQRTIKYLKREEEWDGESTNVVPKLVFKKGMTGGLTPSAGSIAEKKEFFEDLIQAELNRMDTSKDSDSEEQKPAEAPKPKAKPAKAPKAKLPLVAAKDAFEPAAADLDDDDDDDLPF